VAKKALVEEQVRYLVKKTREDDNDWLADEDDESQLAEGIDSDNSLSSKGHCVNENLEVRSLGAPCSSASVSWSEMPYSDNVSCATSQGNTALQSSDLVASSSECGDECNFLLMRCTRNMSHFSAPTARALRASNALFAVDRK